jgi:hypothetical protein
MAYVASEGEAIGKIGAFHDHDIVPLPQNTKNGGISAGRAGRQLAEKQDVYR